MKFIASARAINVSNGTSCDLLFSVGDEVEFTTKTYVGGKAYYRTSSETDDGGMCAFDSTALGEI